MVPFSQRSRIALVGALLIGGAAGGAAAFRWHEQVQQLRREQRENQKRRASWEELKQQIGREVRQFHGESAIWIEDLGTGWTVSHQAERLFPAASVVKVPIMAVCFQAAQQGKVRLDERILLHGADRALGSGLLKSAPNGVSFTLEQLIELMITRSDNTAANLIIRRLGFDYLNESFRGMGLTQTRLSRRMMDFSQRKHGVENYTTAEDLSLTLRKLYQHQLVSAEVSGRCLDLLKRQAINDRIPALLPAGTVVAHKTGLEKGICHDSGIVFTPAGDLLVCVLTRSRNKTARPAKKFIARVASYAHEYKTRGWAPDSGKAG